MVPEEHAGSEEVGRVWRRCLQRCVWACVGVFSYFSLPLYLLLFFHGLPHHHHTSFTGELRRRMKALCSEHGFQVVYPPKHLCTDNGVNIAWAGMEKHLLGHSDSLHIGQCLNFALSARTHTSTHITPPRPSTTTQTHAHTYPVHHSTHAIHNR